ncbi:FCD domain-containing protein [Bauldia litoralis]|uniref:FCD domain-containing protein n=1 Tax=Bauldia litoralis TaxID=665467 RepID=UPI0032631F9C
MPKVPVVRRKRAHDVADGIEKLIDSGEFAVGERLPTEKDLMQRFGVGRPAVREALFFLEQQGIVEIINGARARVIPPSAAHLVQQFTRLSKRLSSGPEGQQRGEQARLVLESGQCWLAATVATDEDVKRLKKALGANVAAVGDRIEFIRTDVAFHYEIAAITGNPIFTMIYDSVVDWLVDQRTTTYHMPDADALSVRDHTAIYEAIAAHDPARAFHEMASHIQLIGQLYRESKRLSSEIFRAVTHDVAQRFEQEKAARWATSFGNKRDGE